MSPRVDLLEAQLEVGKEKLDRLGELVMRLSGALLSIKNSSHDALRPLDAPLSPAFHIAGIAIDALADIEATLNDGIRSDQARAKRKGPKRASKSFPDSPELMAGAGVVLATLADAREYVARLERLTGKRHLVFKVPKGTTAHVQGWRYGTCEERERLEYEQDGAEFV